MKIMNTQIPLDLRKLRHAIVLSECGTFARASRELHITQSALTRSIQALENDLGVDLFERSPTGVRPTIAGSNLLLRAQSLLTQANGLRHDAHLVRDGWIGNLTIGMGLMLTPWLGPALSKLAAESPQLDLRIEIEPAHRLQEMLLTEKLEFFIADVSQLPKDGRVVQEKIGSMQINYFARPAHPLASRRNLTMQDIQKFPLVTSGFLTSSSSWEDAAGWPSKISCESVEMLKSIASHCDGIVLAATAAMSQEWETQQFVPLRMRDHKKWTSDVRVVALADRNRSPLAKRVIAELSAKARQIS